MKRLVILLIAIFLASCSAQGGRTMFLAENVNKITQDEIIKDWGLPQSTSTSGDDATVLIYKYVSREHPRVFIYLLQVTAQMAAGSPGVLPGGVSLSWSAAARILAGNTG